MNQYRLSNRLMLIMLMLFNISFTAFPNQQTDSLIKELHGAKPLKQSELTLTISEICQDNGDYFNMLEWCLKHLQIVREHGFKDKMPYAYFNLGIAYQSLEEYVKAMEAFKSSLSSGITSVDWKLKASTNLHISAIYEVQGNLAMAIQHLNASTDLYKQAKDDRNIADCLVKLGLLQIRQKKYSPAKATYLSSIGYYIRLGDKKSLIGVMNYIGLLEEEIKQNDSAMRYYRIGLSLAKEIPDSSAAVRIILNTADLLMSISKYSEAKSMLNKGIRLSIREGMTDDLIRGRQLMAKLLYKQGNYKDAFNYLSRSARFSDSISGIRNKLLIDAMGAKYYMELKEANIQSSQQEGISKPFTIMHNSWSIYFLVIVAILIGILSTLFYLRNKNKDKISNLLFETNREIENRENELNAISATKDKFFSIIAQDLRNPFTAILGFADILKEEYGTLDEKEKMLYIRAIHSSSFNIYELLKNLHDWSRTQSGTLESKPAIIDLTEMAEQHIQLFTSYAQNKDILLSIESQGQATAFADRNMVSAIIRNLLNNAIKFTNKGGEVHVIIQSIEGKVELSVTDIGVGMSEENLKKLFSLGEAFRSKGTADESGTGLGLILCKQFVSMNHGAIRAESAPGKGSRFTITLPANAP